MSTFVCCSCNEEVFRNLKLKNRAQKYCGKAKCQKARKAKWRRDKIEACPEFKSDQSLCQKKWVAAHPDYWQGYRQRKPSKAERNRILQRLRNHRVRREISSFHCKDRRVNSLESPMVGDFWLVPKIAKIDAIKVNISMIH